jgi:hypothetical protein
MSKSNEHWGSKMIYLYSSIGSTGYKEYKSFVGVKGFVECLGHKNM